MYEAIPANETSEPLPCAFQRREAVRRVFRTVLAGAEQGLGVRVVVADPRSASGSSDTKMV